jgi:CRISPR-associated protein Cmr6
MKLPLPFDTSAVLRHNNVIFNTSNLSLLFNKFVSAWSDNWMTDEKRGNEKVNLKSEFLNKIEKESTYSKEGKRYVDAIFKRQSLMLSSLQSTGLHVDPFTATTDSRLIIGLGGTSVIETGMTLHPLYGFPYLPGSGLKGLARAYAEIVEDFPDEDTKKKFLHDIFGSEDKNPHNVANNRQGKVFFMDGLPTAFPKLELDIINPHYGEYYRGEKPPADYLNPVPVTFLAVAAEQKFSFAVYSRYKDLAEKAKEWLIGGLTELGAGGKTNVGYGYFKVDYLKSDNSIPHTKNAGSKQSTISAETIKWENAILTWSPGNQILKATKDNNKAEIKVADRKIIPLELHNALFNKKKSVTANVLVEKVGNTFKIVSVS